VTDVPARAGASWAKKIVSGGLFGVREALALVDEIHEFYVAKGDKIVNVFEASAR